jgi:23S rRNA pseudouridine1911/1915/1917 synthase
VPPVPILHRDEHLVVVDKPAGMLVVPAPGRRGPTLGDVLAEQLGARVQAVHRLDEDTTGALVMALDDAGRTGMEALFRSHAVHREYLALLAAAPSPPAGRIDSLLREDADGIVRVVPHGGVRAVTHYETIDRRGRCTLVRCRLETGRRNQIRVHMSALECPIAGDRKYGFRQRSDERFARVMLHSWRVQFTHPVTGADIDLSVAPREPELAP